MSVIITPNGHNRMEITADEAKAVVESLKIVMQAIDSGAMSMQVNQDVFYRLVQSAHAKLTNKDSDLVKRATS